MDKCLGSKPNVGVSKCSICRPLARHFSFKPELFGDCVNAASCAFKNSCIESYYTTMLSMDQKRNKRSKPDSVAPNCREECHRHLVAAMVQKVDVAALAGEIAKRIVPQVTGALSVDELASQLVSKHRAHLTTTPAKALTTKLIGHSGGVLWPENCCVTSLAYIIAPLQVSTIVPGHPFRSTINVSHGP